MNVRSGEQVKKWFRGERFAQVNNQWFFTKRGFAIEGPFTSKQDAETGLLEHIRSDRNR